LKKIAALILLAAANAAAADTSLLATLTNPVSVVFNNTYKGLVEENEKIAAADPRNSEKYLFAFLASATATLDVCVYDIEDPGAVTALLDAKSRGVRVRAVSEYDNAIDKEHAGQLHESFEQLRAAGIPVVIDKHAGLMHCKFVVADGERVWFASMNWTHNALYRDNNNNVFVRSREVAGVFEGQFRQVFEKHDLNRGAAGTTSPIRVGDAELTIRFSPEGGAQAAILDAVKSATNSIRFMVFAFTDRDLGNLIAKKKHDGLTVEGVFDECEIDTYSEFRWLAKQGVKEWRDGNQALLHHKVIIIDDETVCCGSYNFTKSAEHSNSEVSVIIRSHRIAAEYRAEFDRLTFAAEHNPPLPPYDHPACQHGGNREAAKPVPR
jgi:phosphatidylserine/phosphatidylglycerophosphate/cardiolipin synthase-like enzyme